MSSYLTPRQFARIAAVGLAVAIVALAIIRGRRADDASVLTPSGHGQADAPVAELARCRTVNPNEAALLETCRRAWAENRGQFFGPARPLKSSPNTAAAAKGRDLLSPSEVGHQQGRTADE